MALTHLERKAAWLGITVAELLDRHAEAATAEPSVRVGHSDPTAAAAVANVTSERWY